MIALVGGWWAATAAPLLAIGYALDAADGQLARLRGGGSLSGEWFDHSVDAVKITTLHLAVLIHLYRFTDLDTAWLLVPIGFTVVAVALFFAQLLNEQLRRSRGIERALSNDPGSLVSIYAKLPHDYGTLCWVFVLIGAPTLFVSVYTFLFAFNAVYLALGLVKWYREMPRTRSGDRTMSRRCLTGALLCITVFVAAGCSGDDDDTSADNTTTSTATSSTTASTTDTTASSTDTTTVPMGSPASNTLPAVGVGTETDLGSNVFVTVTQIEPTSLTARGPGEVSGPGVIVTIEVRNATNAALDLAGLAINAHYGDGTPAVPAAVQQDALNGTVAPGERKTGKYTFSVPQDQYSSVVVDIQHSGLPNVVIVDASG